MLCRPRNTIRTEEENVFPTFSFSCDANDNLFGSSCSAAGRVRLVCFPAKHEKKQLFRHHEDFLGSLHLGGKFYHFLGF